MRCLAAHAHLAADNAAVDDGAAGDIAALGETEDLADLGLADDDFLEQRIEKAGHGFLHVVDQFVDDGVELDLHALVLGLFGGAAVHAGVEAEDDGVWERAREEHVGGADRTDGAVDDLHRHLAGVDLFQSVADGAIRN
jgi:hypothetical protein